IAREPQSPDLRPRPLPHRCVNPSGSRPRRDVGLSGRAGHPLSPAGRRTATSFAHDGERGPRVTVTSQAGIPTRGISWWLRRGANRMGGVAEDTTDDWEGELLAPLAAQWWPPAALRPEQRLLRAVLEEALAELAAGRIAAASPLNNQRRR